MRIETDKIYCGDSLQVLQTLPENAVDCCVTSPPYYALRDYGADGQIGREATPEEYVSRITAVFHEVKRVLTIPREIPPDQYAVLVREFCEQQFVSKGMIADFAIHAPHPPGHNPHAHVMLTMRAMDEHGKDVYKRQL